jgi:hypothetical protein
VGVGHYVENPDSSPDINLHARLPETHGPVLVNFMRDYQIEPGVDHAGAYQTTLFVMSGFTGGPVHSEPDGSAGAAEVLALIRIGPRRFQSRAAKDSLKWQISGNTPGELQLSSPG